MAHAAARQEVGAFQPLTVQAHDPERIDSAGQLRAAAHRLRGRPDGPPHRGGTQRPDAHLRRHGGGCAAASVGATPERPVRRGAVHDPRGRGPDVPGPPGRNRSGAGPARESAHKRGISGRATPPSSAARRDFWVDRNVVALAIRYWPTRHLLAATPLLAVRSARALLRGRGVPGAALHPAVARQLFDPPRKPARHAAPGPGPVVHRRVGPGRVAQRGQAGGLGGRHCADESEARHGAPAVRAASRTRGRVRRARSLCWWRAC